MVPHQIGTENGSDSTVSERVVTAVAATLEEDPLKLPPLYDVIDPDALNELFGHGGERNGFKRMSFTFADCGVVVHGDGQVDVTDPDGRSIVAPASAHAIEQHEAETALE